MRGMEVSQIDSSLESRLAVRRLIESRKAARKADASMIYPPGWEPKTPAQIAALESLADILFFGGAAGSLKTETMLVDAVRERNNPNLNAIIFRQQFTQMTDIVEKTRRLYQPMGGKFVGQPFWTWTFPSGSKLRLAYISADKDVWEYLGPRYSFIGFDESTLHTEYQIRNMLGRLSSTDKTLQLRMRLASNPGGIGAPWHRKMFLRNACPVHQPETAAVAARLYGDACWPSDGLPLCDADGNGFTVAFIPGRLTDHTLLDDKYVYRLRMMSGSLSQQMEVGCWCKLKGAYFANWNSSKMLVPYAAVGETWWDSHFISIDYGIGKSSASAHLHVRTQDNKIRTIGEIVAPDLPVYEFANRIVDTFIAPTFQGQQRRIVAVYADPANFNANYDRRTQITGHSVADQINEALEPYGLSCTQASNDRIGGWQLMYKLLNSGEYAVADTCPKLAEAIPTRMHDEKKPGDIMKVPGDPLDDVMDDARYGIYTFISVAEKPREVRLQEAMAKIPLENVSDRVRVGQQVLEELEEEERPIQMGRSRGMRR